MKWAEEMSQTLKALAALAQNPSGVSHLFVILVPGALMPSSHLPDTQVVLQFSHCKPGDLDTFTTILLLSLIQYENLPSPKLVQFSGNIATYSRERQFILSG